MWNDVEKLKAFKEDLLKKALECPNNPEEDLDVDKLMDPEEKYRKFDEKELTLLLILGQMMSLISAVQLRI